MLHSAAAAATTTMTSSSNWVGGNWNSGAPGGGTAAVIASGVIGSAFGPVANWQGSLTLTTGSQLAVRGLSTDFIALAGASTIYLNGGATIIDDFKTCTISANFALSGGGGFQNNTTAGWNQGRTFTGVISGDGGFSLLGNNQMGYFFNLPNTFAGGLVLKANNRYGVQFNAPGAAGAGNVTVLPASSGCSAALRLGANDVFAKTATLTLNGAGWNNTTVGFGPFAPIFNGTSVRIDMQGFNASVSKLVIDGVQQAPGTYTKASGSWIRGTGTLTVQPITPNNPVITITGIAGDVNLAWNNPLPSTGTNVWDDVWVGTDPGTLTEVATGQLNLTSFDSSAPSVGTYYVRIDTHLDGNANGTPVTGTVFSFQVLAAPIGLSAEYWYNLPSVASILNLDYQGISMRPPNSVAAIPSASLANLPANSGVRLRGALTPTVSGTYTLYVSGDTNVALWLSSDGSRFHKKIIARDLESTAAQVWNQYPQQQSAPLQLVAGTSYYIEAQVMNTDVAGHLELGWSGPGITTPQVIPTANLTTLQPDPADTNDNNLPDTWENQTGLDVSTLPGAHSEYGDPENDGISNFDEYTLGSNPLVKETIPNGLTRDTWTGNIVGDHISFLTSNRAHYLNYPNETTQVPNVDESFPDVNYGSRYRGFLIAPVTGAYTFWVAGNDQSELWIADGTVKDPDTQTPLTNRFGKQRIAWIQDDRFGTTSTPLHAFDTFPSQRSRTVNLTQGQSYYIEVLHKQYVTVDNVSIAWQPPGQARAIIPSSAFTSDVPDDNDRDGDFLPDTWELAHGLNPADNGLLNPNDGQYGDPDGDGLTNLDEYQHGTNPFNADTDGDGVSDYNEIYLFHTNPLVSNNLSPATVAAPPPAQYAAATGSWSVNANGSISETECRGVISYSFTLSQPGVVQVSLTGAAIGILRPVENLSIVFSLNDDPPFATTTLVSHNGGPATVLAVSPWLPAGTYTLNILNDNYRAVRSLRIDSLLIQRLGGQDLSENGVPDWIEQNGQTNNVLTRNPTESRTSPASIEGITERLSTATLSVLMPSSQQADPVTIVPSINNTFFADVPLSADGAVTLNSNFLNGLVQKTDVIIWIPTNLFDSFADGTLHIRKGDSLRLDAWSGTAADAQPFTVTLNGTLLADQNQNTTHSSGQPFVATFDTPGTFTLITIHDGQTATVTLQVHAANFGPAFLVRAYQPLVWTPTLLDPLQIVVADDQVGFTETTANPQTGPRTFMVSTYEGANRQVISRLPDNVDGAPSAILASGTIDSYYIADMDETANASVVFQYSDGTWLMSSTMIMANLPPQILIQISALQQGTLFPNGDTSIWLDSSKFNADGIATIYYESSATSNAKLCHYIQTFIQP